jgi:hypothetical protein
VAAVRGIRLFLAGHRTHGCLASAIQLAKPGARAAEWAT